MNARLEPRLQSAGKALAAQLDLLFAACPALSGFSVLIEGDAWALTDVAIWPQFGAAHDDEIFDRIAGALSELLDRRPEAIELLSDRTFARTLH